MSESKDTLPELQVNRRRHSAIYEKPQHDTMGLLPTFNVDKSKQGNRRHSMMAMPNIKRTSIDIRLTEQQRRSLQLPRYSQVFGFSTFTGLPLLGYKEPVVQYENTYKMEPEKKFQAHVVQKVVDKVIDDILDWDDDILTDDKPEPKGKSEKVARTSERHKRRAKVITKIVEEVKDEVKLLEYERYKFVVNAIVGEKNGQGLRVASRSLWNTNTDNFVCVQREGKHCYVIVLVHAVYFE